MHHRYGRHGPHAWKRLQERKYVQRPSVLPVPVVPTTMFVRIVVPVSTERIVVILMPENEKPNNDEERKQDIQIYANQGGHPTPFITVQPTRQDEEEQPKLSSGDRLLITRAQWQAFNDAKEIERLRNNGLFIRIDQVRLKGRIEGIVNKYLLEDRSAEGGPPPNRAEYQRLVHLCQQAYQTRFQEETSSDQERLPSLVNVEEARLRELAIQDRKEAPTYDDRDYHIRDIAVVRVLQVLSIPLDTAKDRLREIHFYADRYQDYYSNPREEVIWPGPDSF